MDDFLELLSTAVPNESDIPESELDPYTENIRNKDVDSDYDFTVANEELEQLNIENENKLKERLDSDTSSLQFTMIHPNDMGAIRRSFRKRASNEYGSKIRPKPYDPYEVAWNQQRINQYYWPGYHYIQQRGPVKVEFKNPNFKSWITDINNRFTRDLNDPMQMGAPYWQKYKRPKSDYVGVKEEISDEEYKDRNYDRMKEQNRLLNEEAKRIDEKKRNIKGRYSDQTVENLINFGMMDENGNLLNKQQREILKAERDKEERANLRKMDELMKQKNNENVIMTNPRRLNKYRNSVFEFDETQNAYINNQRVFEQQKSAMMGRPVVGGFIRSLDQNTDLPKNSSILGTYGVNSYSEYYKKLGYPTMPSYNQGYGYYGVSGMPDPNGLPTRYYDDGKRYLNPTRREIERNESPVIFVCRTQEECDAADEQIRKDYEFRKLKRKPKYDILKDDVEYELTIKTTDDTGYTEYKIYDSKLGRYLTSQEVHDKLNHMPPKDAPIDKKYAKMLLECIEQMEKDDTPNLVTELSRYNTYVADCVDYFRDILDRDTWTMVQEECQHALRKYRDADPLAIYKSTIITSTIEHTIVTVPKPAMPGEIEKVYLSKKDTLPESCQKIYDKIPFDKTGKDQVEYLSDLIDFKVLPRKEETIQDLINKMVNKLTNEHKYRLADYLAYKNIFRSTSGIPVNQVEKEFYKWWNKPYEGRKGMTQEDYEDAYASRMAYLADLNEDQFRQRCYTPQQIFDRQLDSYYQEMNRLTNGAFSDPNISANKRMSRINYAYAIINQRQASDIDINLPRGNKGWRPEWFYQCLNDRREACKQYGGLDPAAAAIWYNPDDPNDPYGVIDLTPNQDLSPDERRQKFVDRLFKRVRRPTIT